MYRKQHTIFFHVNEERREPLEVHIVPVLPDGGQLREEVDVVSVLSDGTRSVLFCVFFPGESLGDEINVVPVLSDCGHLGEEVDIISVLSNCG